MSGAGATATARPRSAVRAVRAALVRGARLKRRLVTIIVLGAVLTCGYLFWLRDSALVQVETVTVTGATSDDARRVRATLAAAAREMTTLHVDREALEDATAPFPVVRSLEVQADFPNGMRIHVVQHRPVAVLASGSKQVPVAAHGSLLSGLPMSGGLPRVTMEGALPARRLSGGDPLAAVRVAAGLPAALRPRVDEVGRDARNGLVVPIEGGPRLIFGTATRVRAKWAAAVRVLADRDAVGADYVDVRIPERPVAGGLPVATVAPVAPADQAADEAAPPSAAEPPDGAAPEAPAEAPPAPPPDAEAAPQVAPAPPEARVGEGGGAAANPQP